MTEEVHTTEKTIFEKIGGEFERQGDYLIPRLTLPPEKEQPIGLFGWQHLDYLKQHRKFTYTNLLTSGRLNNIRASARKIVNEEIIYA